MNENFKNLMLLAQQEATKETQQHSFAYESFVFEKFAQLLLKECIDILDKKDPDFNAYSKRVLKEHFGIK